METIRKELTPLQKSIAVGASAFALVGGLVTLIGWFFNIIRLTDWFDDGISMFATPALCAILLAISIQLLVANRARAWIWLPRFFSAAVAIFAVLTLWEHVSGVGLGIDTLVVERTWGQNASTSSMRMGVPACISFLSLGLALGLSTGEYRERRLASIIILAALIIPSVSLIGYWFGADSLYGIARITAIARQTSFVILALAIGVMAFITEYGFTSVLIRNDTGGIILRRLLLPAIAIPIFLSWFRILGQNASYFDNAFGTALQTILEIFLFTILLMLTARKLSRQAFKIAEMETRIESVLATGEVGTWELDIPSRMVTVDNSMLSILGMDAERTTRRPQHEFLERIDNQDQNRVDEALERALKDGESYEIEFRLKSGNWLMARGRVERDSSGNPTRMPGVAFDVTKRKESEEYILQANKNKDEFLATLAHELRNPLSPIATSLLLLRDSTHDGSEANKLTEIADRHVKQLIRLVDDLLDVSRISRGKVILQKSICRLQNIVEQAVESIQETVETAKHILDVSLPNQSIFVYGDAARLTQIVTNILSNAAKYTPDGGKISIVLSDENEFAVIEIIDNGIGIAADSLDKVFGLFTQLNDRDTTGKGGLGIGLSLVKQLVELHDGRISVFSDGEGLGTRVFVEIPRYDGDPTQIGVATNEPPTDVSSFHETKRKILVVDDLRSNTLTLSRLLERMGHEVRSANSGVQALELISTFHPQVIISDVSMPDMNGYELASEIRRRWGNSIQMVAMTGYGSQADRDKALQNGFNVHMVKPPDNRVLKSFFLAISNLQIEFPVG